MEPVTFDQWKQLDLRVGQILEVERVPKTAKLYRLQVEVGMARPIQIVTSLVPYYAEEELRGRSIVVLVNLQPTKFAGQVSEGMLFCAETPDGAQCVLLVPAGDLPGGTPVT